MSNLLTVYSDGAARGNPGKAGAGVVLKRGNCTVLKKSVFLGFTTNNVAEYRAFIIGLEEALKLGAKAVILFTDSELLVRQIRGEYRVKNEKLKPLFHQVKYLLSKFTQYDLKHIKREQNLEADLLANQAIEKENDLKDLSIPSKS